MHIQTLPNEAVELMGRKIVLVAANISAGFDPGVGVNARVDFSVGPTMTMTAQTPDPHLTSYRLTQ